MTLFKNKKSNTVATEIIPTIQPTSEIYTVEEATAVREGRMTVEEVMENHKNKVIVKVKTTK